MCRERQRTSSGTDFSHYSFNVDVDDYLSFTKQTLQSFQIAFYMFEPSLKTASCFQIKTPPPAVTADSALLTSVLELIIRNLCSFMELKGKMYVSSEVMDVITTLS